MEKQRASLTRRPNEPVHHRSAKPEAATDPDLADPLLDLASTGEVSGLADLLTAADGGIQARLLTGLQASQGNRTVLQLLASQGQPLDGTIRAQMEHTFGQDFGQVRVHTDGAAAATAEALDAYAYAVGNELVFGAGQYAPETPAGRYLLAHELTHVVQQRTSGPNHDERALSEPGDAAEQEATGIAQQVMAGQPVAVPSAPAAPVAREKDSWWQTLYDQAGYYSDQAGLFGNVTQGIMQGNLPTFLGQTSGMVAPGAYSGFNALGGVTGGLGLVTGLAQMLDPESSTGESVQGGLSATSGAIGLLGSIFPNMAAGGAAGLGAEVIGTGAGTAFGAGAGAAIGSAGAVLGAGLAGWGLGTAIAENTRVGDTSVDIWGGIDSALTAGAQGLGLMEEGEGQSALLSAAEWAEENPVLATLGGIAASPILIPSILGVGAASLIGGAGSAALDYGGQAIDFLGDVGSDVLDAGGDFLDWAGGGISDLVSGIDLEDAGIGQPFMGSPGLVEGIGDLIGGIDLGDAGIGAPFMGAPGIAEGIGETIGGLMEDFDPSMVGTGGISDMFDDWF